MNKTIRSVLVNACLVALVGSGALPTFAASSRTAVKTVTWTLPSDWEESAEFGYPTEPVGAPLLKFIPVSIKVAEGSVYSNCTVEATWEAVELGTMNEELGMTDGRPSVIQEPFIVGEKPVVTPEDPQYFGLARYPATPENVGGIENCAGEASIRAWVTPYRWNGQAGILEKATSLKLTFTYIAPRAAMKLTTSTVVDNYTGVMYIISPPNFTNLWQTYVDYRKTTHPAVEFHIVDTQTEIYDVAAYDGHDDALRIHKYLEARYAEAKAANRKMYAILGAGCAKGNESYNRATMIPLRMTAAANTYYYPSDLYYSCMDKVDDKGEVWDYDGDQVYLGYKKSGGGYASDAAWKVDWMPDIAAFRFPVRTSAYLQNVSSSASKTYAAKEQINGLVNKLKIYEGAAGKSRSFGGHFKYSVSYHKLFEDMYRGSTDEKIAGERSFFDGIANMWTASHNATIEDSEMITRYLNYAYANTGRPVAGAVNNTQVPNNDVEITTHSSHGQEQTAAPFQAYDFFANSRIQFFMNTGTSCLTGKIDTGDVDGHGNLCFAEACILNPNGGAIVTLNNIREGWGAYPGYHETLSLVMQAGLINGFYRLGDSTAYEAFIKGHKYAVDRVGNPSGTMAGCYVESNMMGDPLAKLSPINDTGTFVSPVGGWFLKDATATNSVNFTGTSGSVNLTVTPATANEEVTLSGSQYKVTGGVTVNNGATLKWNAPGGFGRNGITFKDSHGKIVCEGENSRYFGTRFSGIDEILVTGYNTTFDFDKTGSMRDVTALKFIGTDTSKNGIGKCNYIRSREGGIFSPSMSIPVVNGTLVLQTTNIGGGGNASDTTTPIFTLTNAVLKIAENPHWANEMLNRPVWMNGATITVAYQSFGFGAKVSGSKGMTLRVFDKITNTISGNYDAEINGPFNVEVLTNAVLKINVPLTKSSYTGSLVKTGEGQLELRAANTFTGGISVNAGTMVFGKEALTSSACGEVTVASNATLQIETLPLASVTKLTVKAGGKLILPGDITTASYQLVDPMVGSLNFEEGALVYNVNDLTKTLKGSTTSDGYYMDTSSFLHWQDKDGTWINGAADDGTKWLKGGEATNAVDFANGNSVMFNNSTNASTCHVAVSGSIQPGYITLNNTKTVYNFTNATSGAKISLENLYTIGDTTFEPEVSAGSKVVVTSGKATYNNLTTASLSVAPEGKLQLKGTLTPATYIKQIVLKVTATRGEFYSFMWITRYYGYQINGMRFYAGDELLTLPVGTTVSASGSFNGKTTTASMTVTASANGVVTGYTGSEALKNVFDNNPSGGWGCSSPGNTIVQSTGSFTITINLGSPMKMFTKYSITGADTDPRSASKWSITVVENTSGSSFTKSTTANTSANSWYDVNDVSYDGASSASVDVSAGGTLFLNGTYNAPITVGENATLAVTNGSMLTAAKGFSMNGSVTLDVTEAKKSGWFEVLHGAGLASSDISKFVLNSQDAAAKIEGGNLYVATQGVRKGPYTLQASNIWDWNTASWLANGTAFGTDWTNVVTRAADDVRIETWNDTTGTVNCAVTCNTIYMTNSANRTQRVKIAGEGPVNCNTLDFSGLKGEIVWEPTLNGANVIAGTNRVILLNGNGGTVSVASNGYVSTVGTFTSYDIQPETHMHFAGSPRSLNMSQLPSQGVLSFENMTIASGAAGAFQKPNITYLVEDGQSLTFADSTGYNARMTSGFDVRGGTVIVNPNGAWWFGQNGITKYDQTGGTFTCNATGSVLFGYQGEASFLFDINVAGGTFQIPNAAAQIYNPANINIYTNGVFRAKGVTVRDSVTGTINVNELGTLEIGSTALATSRVTYNLYGGALTCFENATVGATLELGGSGTLAATNGTTLAIDGTIKAENSTLNFGKAGYTGTVFLEAIPEGVTNITVTAGTWDMGELRPTNSILSRLDGYIAIELSDEELRTAATSGFKVMKAPNLSTGMVKEHLKVVTSSGTEVPAIGRVESGNLILSVSYVYPLYATIPSTPTPATYTFDQLAWSDAIGMPFQGEWSAVTSVQLTNALTDVTVVVTNAFTKRIDLYNNGSMTVTGAGSVVTLSDDGSTGTTTVDITTVNSLCCGADTIVKKKGTGALSALSGRKVTLCDGVSWGSYEGIAAGATIRFCGDRGSLATSLVTTTGVIVEYENATVTSAKTVYPVYYCGEGDNWTLNSDGGSGLTAPITVSGGTLTYSSSSDTTPAALYYGGVSPGDGIVHSLITITGGKFVVTADGQGTSGNGNGLLLGTTATTSRTPTVNVSGGSLEVLNSSINFWETAEMNISGMGLVKAKGVYKGCNTTARTGTINISGGKLSVGSLDIIHNSGTGPLTINLNGGTLSAWENCEVKSGVGMTCAGTSYLSAEAGKTLTVSVVPTGTGMIICNPNDDDTGTVILKGGDYSNVKLGGTFTIYLQSSQESAVVDTVLFTPASEDIDLKAITVRKSDGSAVDGAVRLYNGKVTFVPATGYAMPAKATIVGDTNLWNMMWHDSSTPTRAIGVADIGKCTEVWLEVASNATFTVNGTKTIPALRIYGGHTLSFVHTSTCQMTLTSAIIETDVVSADNVVVFTTANIAAGKTLEIGCATDVGAVTGTGTLRLMSENRNYAGLDLSKLGNSASTLELAGTNTATSSAKSYLAQANCNIGALLLSGAMTLNDGFSQDSGKTYTITYSFGKLLGDGSLSNTASPTYKLAFADASEFAGSLYTAGAQIGIGANPTYADGTIAVAGKVTIAAGKQWYAVNGIIVQAGGELSIACPRPDGQAAPVQNSALTVDVGGYLNLVDGGQGTDRPTEYVVSSGDLVINGGIKLNGKIVRKDAYTIGNGKITFNGAQTAGDSVSINVIGGNNNLAGKSIANSNTAGVIPVMGCDWNQGASKSNKSAVNESLTNLKEVLSDGTVIEGPMKATLVGACAYAATGTTPANGDGEMMYGYLDDGQTSGSYGATITVENIPYTQYAVYIYMGTDVSGKTANSFAPVTVIGEGRSIIYPTSSANTAWGSADSTHGTVTLSNADNYLMFSGFTGRTLTIKGYKNGTVSGARCGIAGIQIFNTGTRVNELTWKGVASGDAWDKTRANWSLSGGTSIAWYEDADALNIAVFTNDTALTLGEEVKPDVVNIASNTTANLRTGFVPKTSTILFSNVSLADVAAISGEMNGGYVTTKGIATTPYYYVNDGTMATVQLQVKEEEWLKSCKIVLTQDGADVKGYVVYAHYLQNGALGTSLENTSSTILNQDIAQSQADKGYGIQNLALHFERQSALTALNAQNFGKDFVVSNGILRVMADELAQDVTLVAGAKIDVISSVNTNVYVVTKGDVLVGGDVLGAPSGYILLNGSALDNESWTFANGTLTRIETGPRILDGGGEIAVNPTNATEYIVSTNNVKPKITIEGAGDHTIVVPPTVTNVVGVAPEKIKVRHGDRDITTAFKREGDATQGVALSLDPNGKVKVKGQGQGEEEISVTPELSTVAGDDHVAETPFVVSDEKAAVGVKSIPGLTYKLMRGTELGTYGHEAASERAETSRVTLKDSAKPADKAFYIIQVTP